MTSWFELNGDFRKPESRGRIFQVWRCRSDDLGLLHPTPSAGELASHYEIEDYYTHAVAAAPQAEPLQRVAWRIDHEKFNRAVFVRSLPESPPLDVLDIGSGAGKMMAWLGRIGHRPVGIEPDPSALSRAPDFPHPVYDGSADHIPEALAGRKFDAILMVHVIEHVGDPDLVFGNLRKLLRAGGRIYLETPNTECLDFRLSGHSWPHLDIPRHLVFWSAKSLSKMATKHGFGVERVSHIGYARQFGSAWSQTRKLRARYYANDQRRIRVPGSSYGSRLMMLSALAPRRLKYDTTTISLRLPEAWREE